MWQFICESQNAVRCHAKRLQKLAVHKKRRTREKHWLLAKKMAMWVSKLGKVLDYFCTFVNARVICEGNRKLNICPFGLYDAKH